MGGRGGAPGPQAGSLGGDEDQGADLPTVVCDARRRARCVPDRPVNGGNSRSLPDSPIHRPTCVHAGRPAAQTDLLGSGSGRAAGAGATAAEAATGRGRRPRFE